MNVSCPSFNNQSGTADERREKEREIKRTYKKGKIIRHMGSISSKQNLGGRIVSNTAHLAEQIRINWLVRSGQCCSF